MIFRAMAILNISLISTYCVLPLIEIFILGMFTGEDDEKPFPYKMIFPYSTKSSLSYGLTYLGSCIAGFTVVCVFFAGDALFGFYVVFTCGQFRILHEEIGNIFNSGNRRGKLNAAARKHQKLIQFCHLLDNFHSPVFFLNFVFSTLLICMVGFQSVTVSIFASSNLHLSLTFLQGKNMFMGDYFKYALYGASLLTQLLVLCWHGEKIIQLVSELGNTTNSFRYSKCD